MAEPDTKDVLEAGAKALFGPVYDLVMKIAGPAAEEYGLMWAESVRMRRTKRLVSGLAKTKRMVEEAGFEPQMVPDKLLLPIFEEISLEEDADLHTMWAALLANAAAPEGATTKSAFLDILKSLSRDAATLLMWIFDHITHEPAQRPLDDPIAYRDLSSAYHGLGFGDPPHQEGLIESAASPESGLGSALDILVSHGVIRENQRVTVTNRAKEDLLKLPFYSLTHLGYQFVIACRPPRPK